MSGDGAEARLDRRWCAGVVLVCVGLSVAALAVPATLAYDPWAWLVWGREVAHLELDTTYGPSWKPLPVLLTPLLAPFGSLAPTLWLVVARTLGLLALVAAYRVARTLAGRVAGVLAAALLVLTPDGGPRFTRLVLEGHSAPWTAGLALWAVDRHLAGRHRSGFVLLLLLALDRPEAWPFLAVSGLWLAVRDPGARGLVAGGWAAIPLLWFGGDWWGSGSPLHGADAAQVSSGDGDRTGQALERARNAVVLPALIAAAVGAIHSLGRPSRPTPAADAAGGLSQRPPQGAAATDAAEPSQGPAPGATTDAGDHSSWRPTQSTTADADEPSQRPAAGATTDAGDRSGWRPTQAATSAEVADPSQRSTQDAAPTADEVQPVPRPAQEATAVDANELSPLRSRSAARALGANETDQRPGRGAPTAAGASSAVAEHPWVLPGLLGGAVAWALIVVGMSAVLGYAALARFYLPAAGLVCVVAAVAVVRVLGRVPAGALRAAAVVAVVAVSTPAVVHRASNLGALLDEVEARALADEELAGLLDATGGPDRLLACGRLAIDSADVPRPALAWRAGVALSDVRGSGRRPAPGGHIVQVGGKAERRLQALEPPATPVATDGRWAAYTVPCP